jgi:hypothetical protein
MFKIRQRAMHRYTQIKELPGKMFILKQTYNGINNICTLYLTQSKCNNTHRIQLTK